MTGLNEIGVKTIGTEVVDLTGETTAQDMITGIQVIGTGGRTEELTEASFDGTVGRGLGLQGGGRDPGRGITGGGDDLRKD